MDTSLVEHMARVAARLAELDALTATVWRGAMLGDPRYAKAVRIAVVRDGRCGGDALARAAELVVRAEGV